MLVSFYGKSSPKLVFGEACNKWYGTCCYFVSTFKRRFVYLHVLCLGVLPVCVCAHPACSVHRDQERTSDPLELTGVWELNPGPLLEQPVPFSTELSLQPGLGFPGEVSLCGPCRPGTWNNPLSTSRVLGWQMCRSYLQPGWFWFWFWCLMTWFFIGRKKKVFIF